MQEALTTTSEWAKEWCVKINSLKTVYTVFSLAQKTEEVTLKIDNQEIPREDTPKYLGITLDKKLKWTEHLKNIESRASRRLSLMKKLAGTKWGADRRILKQVYTGNVRPVMEYGAAVWATAAKTNTERLDRIQNAGLRMITGGLKSTPIETMETATELSSLKKRREEKIMILHEKLQRIPSHPAHLQMQEATKKDSNGKAFYT